MPLTSITPFLQAMNSCIIKGQLANLLRITHRRIWQEQQLDLKKTQWSKWNLGNNWNNKCLISEENKKQSHLQLLSVLLIIYILFQHTNHSCYVTVTNPALKFITFCSLTAIWQKNKWEQKTEAFPCFWGQQSWNEILSSTSESLLINKQHSLENSYSYDNYYFSSIMSIWKLTCWFWIQKTNSEWQL